MVDLFDEADALFAVRGLGLTRQAEPEAVVVAVTERVAAPNAALLVVLNEDETIKECRLLAHRRNAPLTFDAAQRVLLFPSWPTDRWDVDFKLHAPLNTTVEAACVNGTLTKLVVTPEARRKDVTVMNCKAIS